MTATPPHDVRFGPAVLRAPRQPGTVPDRPEWTVVEGMVADLHRALGGLADVQRRLLEVTGEAWSEDQRIRVVVGPRGQLVALDIDPRVLREPDSTALSAAILDTARRAVADVMARCRCLVDATLPEDLRPGPAGPGDDVLVALLRTHDGDLAGSVPVKDASDE